MLKKPFQPVIFFEQEAESDSLTQATDAKSVDSNKLMIFVFEDRQSLGDFSPEEISAIKAIGAGIVIASEVLKKAEDVLWDDHNWYNHKRKNPIY